MSESVLEGYLAGVDPSAAPLVRALDAAIRGTCPDFDVAINYRILMYTLHADWRTWVCVIDASAKRVCLRFLYGVMLADPRHVLRAGSSVLMTWDFALDAVVDSAAVGAYVAEAVDHYAAYKAGGAAVLTASRAAAAQAGGRPRRRA